MSKNHLLLAIIFIVGCAAGGVSSQLAIPAARAGTNPTRWEYMCQKAPSVASLNEAGAEGWELTVTAPYVHTKGIGTIVTTDFAYCFKRALP